MSIAASLRLAELQPCFHGGVAEAELLALGLDPAGVIDFSVNTNPLGPPPGVREALAALDVDRYPDDGATALRAALARRLGLAPEWLLAANGSLELLWLLALAYLDVGDAVVVVGPTFGEYGRAARLAGARVVEWTASERDGFRPDIRGITEIVARARPRLVFLCNPNNPTGAYVGRADLERLAEACSEGLLVIDEAYLGFVDGSDSTLELVGTGRVALLRSLTKDYGLAGLRLGYAVALPQMIERLNLARPPWSVNAAAQAAGLVALADEAHLARARDEVRAAKLYLERELARLDLPTSPSAANFVLVRVGDGAVFRQRLLHHGCCVRDCASFGLPAFVRIGIRTLAECERLAAAMESACLGGGRAG